MNDKKIKVNRNQNTISDNGLLQLNDIQKKHDDTIIISGLNLSLNKHERLTLFAPSGYGKTSLLSIIAGLDNQFTGTVRINAKNISMVFQETRLFPHKTVNENILYPLIKNKREVDYTMYNKWLKTTGLSAYQDYYPYQISGGMKQMVSIMRAFILNPELVLLDEPLKSIDIVVKKKIISFIRDNYNSAVLMVTHAIDEIALLSHTMLLFQTKPLSEYEIIEVNDDNTADIMKRIIHY